MGSWPLITKDAALALLGSQIEQTCDEDCGQVADAMWEGGFVCAAHLATLDAEAGGPNLVFCWAVRYDGRWLACPPIAPLIDPLAPGPVAAKRS